MYGLTQNGTVPPYVTHEPPVEAGHLTHSKCKELMRRSQKPDNSRGPSQHGHRGALAVVALIFPRFQLKNQTGDVKGHR